MARYATAAMLLILLSGISRSGPSIRRASSRNRQNMCSFIAGMQRYMDANPGAVPA
jgi:hypothetical protein